MRSTEPVDPERVSASARPDEAGRLASLPVVGIGASAGGLEAVRELLAHLPADTGMAFVLVQHLDPNYESKLVELLAQIASVRVVDASDGLKVEPNHFYIIPPNKTLTISSGVLHLEVWPDGRGPHLPIDRFFQSLAENSQTRAIGVVLSGTGTDGTLGIEEIKAAGGFTFAQDEESAKHSGMPQSAIRSGCVDIVLPPDRIAQELVRISRHPMIGPSEAVKRQDTDDEALFPKVLEILHRATGADFSGYRDSTVRRRIMRRVVLRTGEKLGEYVDLLGREASEVDALYHDILISVTSFFRDPSMFEVLKTTVFPAILRGRDPKSAIRVWVAGCSTGQEAYSIAIALLEYLDGRPNKPPVQIFATDLSDSVSLLRAREGIYPKNIEAQVSPERLRRYFSRTDDHYRVNKALRDICVFARQDVVADPPFSHVDLISCRNLLIYLGTALQKRVIPTFHYALNPNGFLLLGPSETVGSHTDLFAVADQRHKIYVKKPASVRSHPAFAAGSVSLPNRAARGLMPAAPSTVDWQREADRVVLNQYAPPGILVNSDLEILQFRGQTGAFLAPAPGEPTTSLLRMAREGLLKELREAVEDCRASGAEVIRNRVGVREEGRVVREVDLRVLPVRPGLAGGSCFLIMFEDSHPRASHAQAADAGSPAGLLDRLASWPTMPRRSATRNREPAPEVERRELEQLRNELTATREYLQSVTEQHDATVEELRSAHEEVLSSNEELQSTNEELETAKEELQSVNEELITVNEQLQISNRDLSRLNDDLTNLLGSADVPMIVLGVDLCIRRFTPAAGKTLGLLPGDIGRAIRSVRLAVEPPGLESMVSQVIETARPVQRELQDRDGRWHALRVHAYRTAENKIDGAVVMLIDIHDIKSAGARLREALDIVETVRHPLLVLDADATVKSVNRAFYETFRVEPVETLGRPLYELGNGQWNIPRLRELLENVLPRDASVVDFAVEHEFERVGPKSMLLRARRLETDPGQPGLILLAIEDVTQRALTERSLERSEERLRLLLDCVTDYAVFFLDPTGNVRSWDEGACQILGYRSEEVIGRPAAMFFTTEDQANGLPERELRTAQSEGRATDENWLVRKDGGRFWASGVTTALRDDNGGVRGFVKVLRDLTDRRQTEEALRESENRLRVALSAAQMGTWHWDIATNRQTLDESLVRLCGLGSGKQIRTLEDFLRTIHPDDRHFVADAFDRSVREGTNLDLEFRVVWPDGTIRWLKDQGDVFHSEAGETLYMTGACVDITSRKNFEEELRRARDELEKRVSERTAELEAANVSIQEQFDQRRELLRRLTTAEVEERRRISRELHDEMGQYLTAMGLDLKLLRNDIPADSPARPRLERLQRATNQISQELHRLAIELRPTALDDLGLVKALRYYLDDWSARTGVRADFHASGADARSSIEIETTIYRITQEALTNVWKHADAKRVSLILQAREQDLTLIIEDDGCGFDARSELEREEGIPHLGLLGMKERIAMLGGTLTVASSPGGPTTLFAHIPTGSARERRPDG